MKLLCFCFTIFHSSLSKIKFNSLNSNSTKLNNRVKRWREASKKYFSIHSLLLLSIRQESRHKREKFCVWKWLDSLLVVFVYWKASNKLIFLYYFSSLSFSPYIFFSFPLRKLLFLSSHSPPLSIFEEDNFTFLSVQFYPKIPQFA